MSHGAAPSVLDFVELVLEMIAPELIYVWLLWQFDDLLEIQNINAVCLPENYRLNVGVVALRKLGCLCRLSYVVPSEGFSAVCASCGFRIVWVCGLFDGVVSGIVSMILTCSCN